MCVTDFSRLLFFFKHLNSYDLKRMLWAEQRREKNEFIIDQYSCIVRNLFSNTFDFWLNHAVIGPWSHFFAFFFSDIDYPILFATVGVAVAVFIFSFTHPRFIDKPTTRKQVFDRTYLIFIMFLFLYKMRFVFARIFFGNCIKDRRRGGSIISWLSFVQGTTSKMKVREILCLI